MGRCARRDRARDHPVDELREDNPEYDGELIERDQAAAQVRRRDLGNEDEAQTLLSSLLETARKQLGTNPKIDYFATSLPNLLLFNDDLAKRNDIEAQFLMALAHHGQGNLAKAIQMLESIIRKDPNHLLAMEMLGWFKDEVKPSCTNLEVSKSS